MNKPATTPRLVLLLKSGPGTGTSIAHKGGYAKYGNPPRWHKITAEAPAPKGAPVAAHPKSAGHHEAAAHFTDDQWAALKLPDSNVNAPVFNKALEKLRAWSDAGDVTAIVGAQYGTNTYGAKLAKIANHLLGLHGSAHTVTPGQKPGTHAAAQVAEPADPHPTGLPEHLAPKAAEPAAPTGPLTMPDFQEGKTTTGVQALYQGVGQKIIDHGHAGNVSVLEGMPDPAKKMWHGKTPNSKKLLALHAAAMAHAKGEGGGYAAPAAEADPLSVHDTPASKVLHVVPSSDPKAGYEVHVATPKSAPGSKYSVVMKDVDSGEFLPTIKTFPTEAAALDHAFALAEGKKPDTGPKEGDTKPGADGTTLVMKDGHWVTQGGGAPAAPEAGIPASPPSAPGALSAQQLQNLQSIPWFKLKLPAENTNAKSHNAAMAKIEAMAFAGDVAGLQAFIESKAGAKQTYAKKQALTAQTALAGLGVEGATAAVPVEPAPVPAAAPAADPYPLVNEWKAAIVAGKVPTKAQAEAFDALDDHDPDAQKEYFLDSVTALLDASGVSNFGDEFDAAYAAANDKVHELHGHALAGTKPTRDKPAITADTPLTPQQLTSLGSLSLAELKAIQNGPGLGANVLAWIDKKVAELEKPAAPVQVKSAVFHNTTAGHNKFWSASLQGSTLKTVYGKIGTKGQATVKDFGAMVDAVAAYQKLIDEKKAKGYQYQGPGVHLHDAPAAAVEQGPKEGDTKPGADGMLVFKNGHWVKVEQAGAGDYEFDASNMGFGGAPTLTSESGDKFVYVAKTDEGYQVGSQVIDSIEAPDDYEDHAFLSDAVAALKAKGLAVPSDASLKKLDPDYKPADPPAIKKLSNVDISTAIQTVTPAQTKFSSNSAGKLAMAAAKKGDATGMAFAYKQAGGKGFPLTAKHIKAVAQAMGVDVSQWDSGTTSASAPVSPPAAAPATPAGGMPSMDDWVQTGGQGGSNPGGKFKDPSGQEWYCKWPDDAEAAKSEVLAAKLYALAGLSSQDAVLVTKGGKVGIASKWVNIKKAATPGALAKVDGAQSGFAVDAWLGNWDVVGLGYDNLQIGPDGKAHRVDAGGSLEYRAQGEKKPFGSKVDELDTLRNANTNPQAASVFKGMTQADLTASAAKVLAISDVAIRAMVNQYGPGDAAAKAKLADTLIARKADLAKRFPAAVKKKKAPVFKPEDISAPPSFLNWGGKGSSGPSSKEFLNKANEEAVQAIFAAAKTGDLDAIKSLKAKVYDKDTGQVTGEKPVLEHPSQHVKGYAQQAVNEINYQLNPPKKFRFDGGHPLHSLNAAYPAFTGPASSTVAQKLGKFIVLGEPGTVKLDDLALPAKIVHSEGGGTLSAQTYAKQAQAAIAKMPATQKQAVKSYTGSSYHAMNGSLWDGNPTGAAKAAGEALKTLGHDIAPGTVLSRKLSLHGPALDQLLAASGKILQEPAIMSTSIRPSSWSGNVQLKLHVGPGVKGLWGGHHSIAGGGALSSNSGEDEMILPPGTRLMILGVKTGADSDGFGKASKHVVEAIVLPT